MRKSNFNACTEKVLSVLNLGKVSLDLLSQKYDSNTIKSNVKTVGGFAKSIIPFTALACAAYVIVPWYAGALAFTVGGPTAAKTTYAASKLLIIGASGMKGVDAILNTVGSDYSIDSNSSTDPQVEIVTTIPPLQSEEKYLVSSPLSAHRRNSGNKYFVQN